MKKKVIERIVESPGAPNENDLWLNGKTLKKFQNGEWVAISGGNSSGGDGDSDSDIQIVELTYEHLPATGTLSASDLAKLDSDNCLLVMNGKYFRKTFSSDGGIDYKEIGLTTVLGGVRSIYFTASKPSGEYTIAYTYPVEANTQTEANATLENIKVGNTTYSVPKVVIIEGVFYSGGDSPITFNGQSKESFAPNLSDGETYASVFDQISYLLSDADVPTLVFVHYYYYGEGEDDVFYYSQIVGGGYDNNRGSYLSLNGSNSLRWLRGDGDEEHG